MIFESIHDARKWFLNYVEFDESKVNSFYESPTMGKGWKFGDYILFQHIEKGKISRPIYGIFTSFTVWDQAIVLQMVENKRAWTYSNKVLGRSDKLKGPPNSFYISTYDDQITQIEFWTGDINLLGHWRYRPSIPELKESLRKQVGNTSYNRDQTLDKLLNE